MRRLLKPFLACGLALTFAALLNPPDAVAQRGTVEGIVTVDDQPVNKAVIRFDRIGKSGRIETKTDKNGRFTRHFIPIGRYKMSLFIEDNKVWEDFVEVCGRGSECLGGQDSRKVPITLRTSKGISQEEAGGLNKDKFNQLNQEFQRGRDMFKAKNYTVAAEAFKKATEMDPDQHVIHYFLGNTYREMRKYDQAVSSYETALAALAKLKPNPNQEVAYRSGIGETLAMAGKEEEAYAAMEKISELAPKQLSSAYLRLAAAFVKVGKSKEAVRAFEKSLAADPTNAEAQYQLAVTLVSMATVTDEGKTIPAPGTIEAYKKYLEIAPMGSHAAEAKSMIAALSSTVKTTFSAEDERKNKKR